MAPQNLSFIETESEKEDKNGGGGGGTSDEREAVSATGRESRSLTPSDPLKRLPERLSQLNISSGSKTYRVHNAAAASTPSQSEKEQSPSPTRGHGAPGARPTISSTFKQSRRSGSAEPGQPGAGMAASGPSSLRSNSGAGIQLTEEEAETLAAMKTERLKDDADASKGFVISFDDEPAKKAKPALKVRRPSKKFSSGSGGMHDLNSDGSSSSRKENVPPELMICIDMNMGSDEGAGGGGGAGGGPSGAAMGASSPSRRKYVSSTRIGNSPPPSAAETAATRRSDWKSYDADPHQSTSSLGHMGQPANDPDHELTPTSGHEPIPKFAVDPSVPLEEMALIGHASEESEGDGGRTTGLIIGA